MHERNSKLAVINYPSPEPDRPDNTEMFLNFTERAIQSIINMKTKLDDDHDDQHKRSNTILTHHTPKDDSHTLIIILLIVVSICLTFIASIYILKTKTVTSEQRQHQRLTVQTWNGLQQHSSKQVCRFMKSFHLLDINPKRKMITLITFRSVDIKATIKHIVHKDIQTDTLKKVMINQSSNTH
jgi:hypothetical protein